MVEGTPITVTDEFWDGKVVEQDPESGDWLNPGQAVTVHIGVLE